MVHSNCLYLSYLTDIVHMLLEHDPQLSKTVGQSNATPLISAATKGHLAVVKELLLKDPSLLEISRSNGKNALHFSARQGHVDIVKALLEIDPQLARRTDKKGQTALHMAVKGVSSAVVKLLLQADAAIVMLPDKFGNTALHIATRKKRAEVLFIVVSAATFMIETYSVPTSMYHYLFIIVMLKCYGIRKATLLLGLIHQRDSYIRILDIQLQLVFLSCRCLVSLVQGKLFKYALQLLRLVLDNGRLCMNSYCFGTQMSTR